VTATYRRIASLRTRDDFAEYVAGLGIELPFDADLSTDRDAGLAAPFDLAGRTIGNRFSILPMEGWDGTLEGGPTEHTIRRWQRFGQSGAKLIWGGEAVAVSHAGRANPHQLWLHDATVDGIAKLREELVAAHRDAMGDDADLLVGLQLTHSGRFARPNDKAKLEPLVLYRHPILDERFGVSDSLRVLEDDEIDELVEQFVAAAVTAADMGYEFVDVKHCHGYLGHEFLSAVDRPGKYGGSFENRTRFLRNVVKGIRSRAPSLLMGVRLSAIDRLPYEMGEAGVGRPSQHTGDAYRYAFGGDETGLGIDLAEPIAFLRLLVELGVPLVCVSVGSPYYNPHIQRPAYFPPTDGYLPPEDPLVGVARQIEITAELKRACPELAFVGSGYTYLQQWLPNVGQAAVNAGLVDFVGLGRMVLSYHDLPADVLAGRELQNKRICRTFSDCTSGPRNGMLSGCFPLDDYYKQMPENARLTEIKSKFRKSM
jgi:2,4-dienoyl-CoA reductase-like NADH-dependent reductase (Old Yellow Enzyme family)